MPKYINVKDIPKVSNPNRDEDVPVLDLVFCKDCKHLRKKSFGVWSVLICGYNRMAVEENDFCSKGKGR